MCVELYFAEKISTCKEGQKLTAFEYWTNKIYIMGSTAVILMYKSKKTIVNRIDGQVFDLKNKLNMAGELHTFLTL